jgi:hypothetical protein
MDTATEIPNRIVTAVVHQFADEHGIARSHLLGGDSSNPDDLLTPAEALRASRVLGKEVVFGG